MGETMRATVLTGFGSPYKLVYKEDWPKPEPGPGEVLIKVGACGVNNTDIWTREGAYGNLDDPEKGGAGWKGEQAPFEFPRIQGADAVGRIEAVGPGVDGSRVGQRVMVNLCLYGKVLDGIYDAGIIGSERDGGFAEYVAVPEENALRVESAPATSGIDVKVPPRELEETVEPDVRPGPPPASDEAPDTPDTPEAALYAEGNIPE